MSEPIIDRIFLYTLVLILIAPVYYATILEINKSYILNSLNLQLSSSYLSLAQRHYQLKGFNQPFDEICYEYFRNINK